MNVEDLAGNTIDWHPKNKKRTKCSQYHVLAKKVLGDTFPCASILEEVSIKTLPGKTLYLDFYIPLLKIAIEIHGEQHYTQNSMFHKSKLDFWQQKKNDREKLEWCKKNGINLIELNYKDHKKWQKQLRNVFNN